MAVYESDMINMVKVNLPDTWFWSKDMVLRFDKMNVYSFYYVLKRLG